MNKKTVLITGATGGIGKGLIHAFAQAGYNVAIHGSSPESIEKNGLPLAEEMSSYGIIARCYAADVSLYEDCKTLVSQVQNDFGEITVLINNAGITRDKLLARMKEEDFDNVIAANLKSVYNMCHHVVPLMMRKRAGWIINLSSVVGLEGNAGQANYAASKAGIIGFTKSLAKELAGRNIICNAIAPGFIETPMTQVLPENVQSQILSSIALKRFGTVEDIGETALFLAKTTYITGQVLTVDGGLSI